MLKYKIYVKRLSLLLLAIFGGAFIYVYIYAKHYPIPLFHRISLDAKMRFIKDMGNRDRFCLSYRFSYKQLNNIQGVVLEDTSKKVKHVLNLSALGLHATHIEQLLKLFSLFPNTKRVIYSAQFEDWSEAFLFGDKEIDLARGYINLGRVNTVP